MLTRTDIMLIAGNRHSSAQERELADAALSAYVHCDVLEKIERVVHPLARPDETTLATITRIVTQFESLCAELHQARLALQVARETK